MKNEIKTLKKRLNYLKGIDLNCDNEPDHRFIFQDIDNTEMVLNRYESYIELSNKKVLREDEQEYLKELEYLSKNNMRCF